MYNCGETDRRLTGLHVARGGTDRARRSCRMNSDGRCAQQHTSAAAIGEVASARRAFPFPSLREAASPAGRKPVDLAVHSNVGNSLQAQLSSSGCSTPAANGLTRVPAINGLFSKEISERQSRFAQLLITHRQLLSRACQAASRGVLAGDACTSAGIDGTCTSRVSIFQLLQDLQGSEAYPQDAGHQHQDGLWKAFREELLSLRR